MGCDWYTFRTHYLPAAIRICYNVIEENARVYCKENQVKEEDYGDIKEILDEDDEEIVVVSKRVKIYLEQKLEEISGEFYVWKTEQAVEEEPGNGPFLFVGTQDIRLLTEIEVIGPYEIDSEYGLIKTAIVGEACTSAAEKEGLGKVAKALCTSCEIASWVWSTSLYGRGYTLISH